MDRSVPWWVGALIAAVVVLLAFQPSTSKYVEDLGSQVLAPVSFYVSGATESVSGFVSSVGSIGTLRQTVQQQAQEIERLNFELVRMHQLEQENADLRNLLGFEKTQPGLQLLPARMVGADATGIVSSITIDKGSQDGVKEDMGVITWKGLVGTVIQVRPDSASVLLITDVGSSISAQVDSGSSQARGIVGGQKDGTLIMRDILQQESLQTGDVVTTLGVGGTLPEGLPIGQVLRVQKRTIDMFQEAILQPAVDMNHLDRLYVILSYPND